MLGKEKNIKLLTKYVLIVFNIASVVESLAKSTIIGIPIFKIIPIKKNTRIDN